MTTREVMKKLFEEEDLDKECQVRVITRGPENSIAFSQIVSISFIKSGNFSSNTPLICIEEKDVNLAQRNYQ